MDVDETRWWHWFESVLGPARKVFGAGGHEHDCGMFDLRLVALAQRRTLSISQHSAEPANAAFAGAEKGKAA
jgi:hypothetical protein